MHSKTSDRTPIPVESRPARRGPAFPDTVAYWLEDDAGRRVSKLFAASEKPLRLAGRALENAGSLDGWTIARRDSDGVRHVVATSSELEVLARRFMPRRSPAESSSFERFNRARRTIGFRRPNVETDERVY